jgi:WD40 repeat protein
LVLNYVGTVFGAWPTVKFKVLCRIARLQCAQPESGESRGLDSRTASWVLALSPNGKRLAVIRSPGSPLEILSLKGELLQQIKIPEWSNSGPVKWAADGKGLFVPSTADGEASLIYVNLRGDVHVLRRNREGDYSTGAPSPDGRHIAIVGTAQSRNFWMMEKF